MAARLPVVISQSTQRDSSIVSCEENLITELLFTAGLDATLIGPLESIDSGSTDHLCLEGLKGPFALLSWLATSECQKQLTRLEIHGTIQLRDGDHPSRFPIELSSNFDRHRQIDYFQLDCSLKPTDWIDRLKKILEARDVKAFSILLPDKSSRPPLATSSPNSRTTSYDPPSKPATKISASLPSEPSKVIVLDDDEEAWVHLDDLMDDLDRSDV